jgi:photosystem II stability/assembly factor-like uncharacterized protein
MPSARLPAYSTVHHSVLAHFLVVLLMVGISPLDAESAWPGDPTVNVPVTTAPGTRVSTLRGVSDGAGGMICAWSEDFGAGYEVYAQRIDDQGNVAWMTDGVPICTAQNDQFVTAIASDGSGGALLVWRDERSGYLDLYGQRVDSNGNVLWTADGRRLVFGPFPAVTGGEAAELLRSSVAGESWTTSFNPSSQDINGASMVDGFFGAVCGDNGTILHTPDGGMTWVNQSVPVGANLYDISMRHASQGLAVGDGGRVLLWNGGSWAQQGQVVFDALRGVAFETGTTAVAVGDNGNIIRTTNGGTSWQTQISGTSDSLRGVDFLGISVAVAVGDNGTIVRSSDGGAFWSPVTSGTSQSLNGVAALDTGVAVAVGAAGTIIRSTDAGISWTTVFTPTSENLNDVAFADSLEGLAVGDNGTIITTKDGGLSWTAVSGGVGTALNTVSLARDQVLRAAMQAVADDAGGMILCWLDDRFGDLDVFAQRIDPTGDRIWFDDVTANVAPGNPEGLVITRNGAGGAFLGWPLNGDVFAQGLDESGNLLFAGPTSVCNETGTQDHVGGAFDGQSGVVFTWNDDRDISNSNNVYAQRVLYDGTTAWQDQGIPVCTVNAYQQALEVTSADLTSVIIVWQDNRTGATEAFAQKVFLDGSTAWQAEGVQLSKGQGEQERPRPIPDGNGGAIVFMDDNREGSGSVPDIYAAVVDANGALRRDDDVPVLTGPGIKINLVTVADGAGGAIAAVQDTRNRSIGGTEDDVYAQNIDRHGYLGDPAALVTTVGDVPNDQGGAATVSWNASYLDAFPEQTITHYTVWRRNEATAVAGRPMASKRGETRSEAGPALERALASGVETDLARRMAAAGWVYLDQILAFYLDEYGYDAPTYGDSTSSGVPLTGFQIIAHTEDPFIFWTSAAATGYSVDNLAPTPPLTLAAGLDAGDIDLDWSPGTGGEPDFSHYAVYHDVAPGVAPGPATFLATTTDTFYTHDDPSPGGHYYAVTAVDVHENDSEPSNEASADVATAARGRDLPPPRLTLLPGSPSPFSNVTTLRFGVPEGGTVTIEVFDVRGGRVFSERMNTPSAGWYTRRFGGRDASGHRLASGVYFYRVTTAAREVQSQKLILMR